MTFARGAAVYAEAEEFGVLGDVVVDPFTYDVTHLVVDPGGDHQQKRLVPLWLAADDENVVRIALPSTHVRQLQRALDSDYVRLPAKLAHDARLSKFKSVLALPHFVDATIDIPPGSEGVPVADCEIRRSSWVVDRTGHVLGTVAGMLVADDRVHSIIVRSGVIGHRHNVAVPMADVAKVASHFVTLRTDRQAFKRAPVTKALSVASLHFRPRELWREVLGMPTNKLWDDFEIDDPPTDLWDDDDVDEVEVVDVGVDAQDLASA